ncbi:MAG: hypothetical protein UW55_C0010G0029 [Candidatus Giovannonibacteria bacterium GW2011_GWA2_44_26]|uniref:Uncharacterized protein n=1 Tax=Candidatus Giovannonibacteria bacterium GW2011_GWA2_44_26 TaxID=1618648 RepID=A0A0G1IUA9_9BACT|nr:MAG: hypothetical protein UW55_C0010G0029 [Candidatus Giovannonibacteria bacterium GW2011_GWA2_44_26]
MQTPIGAFCIFDLVRIRTGVGSGEHLVSRGNDCRELIVPVTVIDGEDLLVFDIGAFAGVEKIAHSCILLQNISHI